MVELATGERTEVGGVEVIATPAVHEGRRFKVGRRVEAAGYELVAGERRVYFAGDTDLFDEMDELAGRLDVALLPIARLGAEARQRAPRTRAAPRRGRGAGSDRGW